MNCLTVKDFRDYEKLSRALRRIEDGAAVKNPKFAEMISARIKEIQTKLESLDDAIKSETEDYIRSALQGLKNEKSWTEIGGYTADARRKGIERHLRVLYPQQRVDSISCKLEVRELIKKLKEPNAEKKGEIMTSLLEASLKPNDDLAWCIMILRYFEEMSYKDISKCIYNSQYKRGESKSRNYLERYLMA